MRRPARTLTQGIRIERMKSTETHRVAIVGAGFAGSLTAAQILRQATGPLEVGLRARRPACGVGKPSAPSLP